MTLRTGESRAPGDDDDVLLDLLGGDADSIASDGDDNLEIDDQQAQEIRQIVLTTLPQYLLPVEQMAAQLFDAYEDELKAALLTTVESVQQATERIGVLDVSAPLERLRKVVEHLDAHSAQDADVQERVLELIAEVKRIATGDHAEGAAPPVATTLVEAFKGVEGVPAGILEKLTAAGLVTLDQLWMADPGEIVAVSGLDAAVVDRMLDALATRHGRPLKRKAAPPPRKDPDRTATPLDAAIREQVENEALVDQRRAEVLRARLELTDLRSDLVAAQSETKNLSGRLAQSREQVASGLARVAELQIAQGAMKKRLEAARKAVATSESRLSELRAVRDSVQRDFEALASGLASIRERVASLMRDAEQTEQGSSSGWIEHRPLD